jgi:hypothetical protein
MTYEVENRLKTIFCKKILQTEDIGMFKPYFQMSTEYFMLAWLSPGRKEISKYENI